MNSTDQLYSKVKEISQGVTADLRAKGLIVPTKSASGVVTFGNYKIVKKDGFYSILLGNANRIVEKINLPQTAILVANGLALGRSADDKLLTTDRQYGYCSFEEEQYKHVSDIAMKKKDWDKFDILAVKLTTARLKSAYAKRSILESFEKLRRIR